MAEQSGLEYRLTELRKYLDEFQSRVDQLLDAWRRVAEMRHTLGSSSFFEDILARFEGELRPPWSSKPTDEVSRVGSDAAPSPRAARGETAARKPARNTTPRARAVGTARRGGSRGLRPAGVSEQGGAGVPNASDAGSASSPDGSEARRATAGAAATREGRGTRRAGAAGGGTRSRAGRATEAAGAGSTARSPRQRSATAGAAEGAATPGRAASRGDGARGERRTTRTAVLEAAAAVGGEFGVSDLVERIRESGMIASETAIRRVVLRMADAGQLARVGRGRYRLP